MIKFNDKNQIEIYDVIPVHRGDRIIKFLTSVSISDLNKVYDRLIYDEETQRGYKNVKTKSNKEKTVRIENKKNIKQMVQKAKKSFFDGGTLSWNVRLANREDTDKYVYSPLEGKLTILKNFISLPDSAQRHEAIKQLCCTDEINIKKYEFPLQICLYTKQEEKNLFSEINSEGQRASKTRALFLSDNYKIVILKNIINSTKLRDNVDTKTGSTYRTDKLLSFSTFFASFFDQRVGAYKNIKEDEVEKFQEWIIEFYNYLIELRPELDKLDRDSRMEAYKKYITGMSPCIVAFAHMAKLLENTKDWKERMQIFTKEYKYQDWIGDFFSIQNPYWHGTICNKNKRGIWQTTNNRRSVEFLIDTFKKYLNIEE